MISEPQRNPDFRPDPERGIFLTQDIDQSVLDKLTPSLLRLQAKHRGPITLYIDSHGGETYAAASLERILKSVDQDGSAPCRVITVATGTAASAAADLLMSGDYALAYPHAIVLCHGVRQFGGSEVLTSERAVDLAKNLANSNERFAIQIADNCIFRFIFRVAMLLPEFANIRKELNNQLLPVTVCFIEALKGRLRESLINVLKKALERSTDNDALDVYAAEAMSKEDIASMPSLQFETLLLKTILDYEGQQHANTAGWSFRRNGLDVVQDKFYLLLDKYDDHHAQMVSILCDRWGQVFLSSDGTAETLDLTEEVRQARIKEVVTPQMRTLWFFFVSVCRLLQKDDYWMSAEEAYWLGLIDEVIGRTDLPCLRLFVEYSPADETGGKESD